jgi:hypothetical protein
MLALPLHLCILCLFSGSCAVSCIGKLLDLVLCLLVNWTDLQHQIQQKGIN